MPTIYYDDAVFRADFPVFADTCKYPQSTLQMYWNTATCYISDRFGGCYCGGLKPKQQTLALNLMTAHLLALSGLIASGETPGILTGATIDKITVSIEPPPATNQWQYWLQTTPYGQQLLALLQLVSVGGTYVGGVPELAAFRRVGGLVLR